MPLMCNNEVDSLEEFTIDYDQQLHQADFVAMDSTSRTDSIGNEDIPRAKFLCSFGGFVLPRPQDGKLRYVGGETRIVSVPRNIGYEELMARMRELYEGASILKYQQPDEDLDALVSVVNDDDVTNMMEEYDKLGSGDGFTRLRIFLFSHLDQDASPHYMDGDERETERMYVDALNSHSESPDYSRQNLGDSPLTTPFDEIHIADQFFNSMNLDGSVHNQRNYEMAVPPYNLGQLANPSITAGQHSSPVGQLHEEAPWSPAVYSPRYAGPCEMRTYTELAPPPSARLPMAYQEITDKCMDKMVEESNHQQVNSQIPFDHQQQYSDQVVWLPSGAVPVDRGGFPGNVLNGPSVVDCPSVCQHCKTTFQRTHSSSDFHRKPEEQGYVEQLTMGNGFTKVASPCVQCLPGAAHVSAVRTGDQFMLDAPSTKVPIGPGNLADGSVVPTTYASTTTYALHAAELGAEVFHGQAMPNGSHVHVPLEEQGVRTANLPYPPGPDAPHQLSHGNTSALASRRHPPAPLHVHPLDPSILQPRNRIPNAVVHTPRSVVEGNTIPSSVVHTPRSVVEGNSIPSSVVHTPRSVVEGSPRFVMGVDQSPWVESPHKRLGGDGSTVPEYPYGHVAKLSPHAPFQEIQQAFAQDPLRNAPGMLMVPPSLEAPRSSELPAVMANGNLLYSNARGHGQLQRQGSCNIEVVLDCTATELTHSGEAESLNMDDVCSPEQNNKANGSSAKILLDADKLNSRNPAEGSEESILKGETKPSSPTKNADLTSFPERIASAKGEKVGVEEVKGGALGNGDAVILHNASGEAANADETESPDVKNNSEGGSENECGEAGKIEPTKAEEEAIAKGLQTIRNADLEEVRELGSGTYGAVYHGKWKGSDVAIKRIKASCFSGRTSERERLIADFWKEALILSSLHHPNVVSFYGVVRDGPDGSLATVTEFMVNGSLKQYLRKKDRTIDRRKRLIIAMDAAFGMEYLHEKNIVHFDLKCENLLVNMRDPHRPVCKIGDLGLSKVKQHTLVSGGVRGTLPWMAPELLSGKSHMVTEKIDVYSFGIVMWELLTGEEPYSDIHCASLIGGIVNNTLRPQIPTWCDPEWKALMESCWASDPAERPSFSEISQKLRTMAAAMNVK